MKKYLLIVLCSINLCSSSALWAMNEQPGFWSRLKERITGWQPTWKSTTSLEEHNLPSAQDYPIAQRFSDWWHQPRKDYVESGLPSIPEEPHYPAYPFYPKEKEIEAFTSIQEKARPKDYYGYGYSPEDLSERLYQWRYPFRSRNIHGSDKEQSQYVEDTTPDPAKIESIRKNIEELTNYNTRFYKQWLKEEKNKSWWHRNTRTIQDVENYLNEALRKKEAANLRAEYLRQHEADLRDYLREYNTLQKEYEQAKKQAEASRAFQRKFAQQQERRFEKTFNIPYE